ncbi:MAG: NTP transferase domain-containing protein [Acidimicrobiia bacterium]|nr:NTP transferase domain-containing protein [Acidimicrobiia bacterium]
MSIAVLVLAAGGSKRLGRPKQLEPWGDSTLLGHILGKVAKLGIEEQWVVLGSGADEIIDNVDLEGWNVVDNLEWQEGIASSIRVGLDALVQLTEVETAVIVLGDQPGIPDEVIPTLLEEHRASERPVTVPKYRYTRSNPAVVDRSHWSRLMSLEGDEGAMRLFVAHPEWLKEVWFEHLPPFDIDTDMDIAEHRPRRRPS